jgi:mannose-6-phosphate isomerase-like protein (cupin superfamily)
LPVKILTLDEVEPIEALGGTIKRMFNPGSAGTEHMTFSVGYFSPGEGLKSHTHPVSEEVYYVVRGRGTVYLGEEGEPLEAHPDTALYIPPGTVHAVENTGAERLVICFFVAPGRDKTQMV